ncbi:MAG: sugar phosphate isomerase/epimerase [Armatimonadota bacterium]|nr:sugar phosphate isomerase/epimerase [Armatimonadota bacterium]
MQLMVFSKHLAGLPLDEVARRLVAMGIDAIDLTVRPGGHVEPERVEDELPRAAESLAAGGVRIGMMTTGITDARDPVTPKILQTAARLGISYYKLGYFMYAGFGTLKKQRAEVKARLQELAALNLEIGIHGGFHNHSDKFLGASLWDVHHVLEDIDPRALGSYLDAAHATVEGGSAGWLMGMDLLSDRITMLAVKDFRWVEGPRGYAGGRRNKTEWLPLADGNTQWPQILKYLHQIGFAGPVSLHSEYQGSHSFKDLTVDEVFEQTARDLAVFREWLAAAQA